MCTVSSLGWPLIKAKVWLARILREETDQCLLYSLKPKPEEFKYLQCRGTHVDEFDQEKHKNNNKKNAFEHTVLTFLHLKKSSTLNVIYYFH